jgi:hypothetical protein
MTFRRPGAADAGKPLCAAMKVDCAVPGRRLV